MTVKRKTTLEEFIEACGGMERFRQREEQADADERWIEANQEELLRHHGETWLAVLNQTVVGADRSLPALVIALRSRGIDPTEVVRAHLPIQEIDFVG